MEEASAQWLGFASNGYYEWFGTEAAAVKWAKGYAAENAEVVWVCCETACVETEPVVRVRRRKLGK